MIRRKRSQRLADEGVVAVEAALVVPVLVFVLALAATALLVVGAKLSAVDASRETARLAARGETVAAAVAAGRRVAPPRATVRVRDRSHWVEALVEARVRPFRVLPAFTVRASTLAEREDEAGPP